MNVEMLRRWVRNELDRDARREVGRWMLRSTDPQLPSLLQGLIKEHEEEVADAALCSKWPGRAFVIDLWSRLVGEGRATFEALRPAELAGGAVLGTAASGSGLAFRRVGDEVVIDVTIAEDSRNVALLATTDLGEEHVLFGPSSLPAGTHVNVARWTPESEEGRVVVWLALVAVSAPLDELRTLASINTLAVRGDAEVLAARWSFEE